MHQQVHCKNIILFIMYQIQNLRNCLTSFLPHFAEAKGYKNTAKYTLHEHVVRNTITACEADLLSQRPVP